VFRTNPMAAWSIPKLATQLVPAVLVTVVGVALLSNLAKTPDAVPTAAPVQTAIDGDAIFTMTPREPAEVAADEQRGKATAARATVKPKTIAASTPQPRKAANEPRQAASLPPPPPLQIVQIPEPPQPAANSENMVMSRLRSATAAVQRMPKWAAHSVAGWFSDSAPPRPPAPVPTQEFRAAM